MQLLLFGSALVFYFVLHSVLAHNKVKTYLTDQWMAKKYYRFFFNFIAIASLVLLFFFYQKIEHQFLFKIGWLKMVGGGLTLMGLIMNLLALRQYNLSEFSGLQQYKHETPPTPETLKTTGFNAYVRHPLYFATLVLLWGFFLFRPTYSILTIAVISTIYIYVGTKLEEEKLVAEFGEAYLKYQKEVNMLLPF